MNNNTWFGKVAEKLSFRKMISPILIKIMYGIGFCIITIMGIVLILVKNDNFGDTPKLLGGLAILVFGNIFWRLICEGWILFFSIHDTLVSIDNELKRRPDDGEIKIQDKSRWSA